MYHYLSHRFHLYSSLSFLSSLWIFPLFFILVLQSQILAQEQNPILKNTNDLFSIETLLQDHQMILFDSAEDQNQIDLQKNDFPKEKKQADQERVIFKIDDKFLLDVKNLLIRIDDFLRETPKFDELDKTFEKIFKDRKSWGIELKPDPENTKEAIETYLADVKILIRNLENRKDQKTDDCLEPLKIKITDLLHHYETLLYDFHLISSQVETLEENLSVLFKKIEIENDQYEFKKIDNKEYVEQQIDHLSLTIFDLKMKKKLIENLQIEINHDKAEYQNRLDLFNDKLEVYQIKQEFVPKIEIIKKEFDLINDVDKALKEIETKCQTFQVNPSISTIIDSHHKILLGITETNPIEMSQSISKDGYDEIKDEALKIEINLQLEIKELMSRIETDHNNAVKSKEIMSILDAYLDLMLKSKSQIKDLFECKVKTHILQRKSNIKHASFFEGFEFYLNQVQNKTYPYFDDFIQSYLILNQELKYIEAEKIKYQKIIDLDPESPKEPKENSLQTKLAQLKAKDKDLRDLEKQSIDQLIERYDQHQRDLEKDIESENELRQKFLETQKEIDLLLEDRRLKLSDPILRQFEETTFVEMNQLIKEAKELFTKENHSIEASAIANETMIETNHQNTSLQNNKETKATNTIPPQEYQPLEKLIFFNEELRAKLPPRLIYYQEYQKYRDQYQEILERRKGYLLQLTEKRKNRLNLIRDVWRVANIINTTKVAANDKKLDILNTQTQSWISQKQCKDIGDLEASQKTALAWFEIDPNFEQMISPLMNWEKLLDQLINLVKKKDELAQKKLKKSDDELTPTEKIKIENDLNQLIEKDEIWYYELLWEIIPDQNKKDVDDMLKNLYRELLDHQSKEKHLDLQNQLLKESIKNLENQRSNIEEIYSNIKKITDLYEKRLMIEKIKLLSSIKAEVLAPIDGSIDVSSYFSKSEINQISIKDLETLQKRLDLIRIHFFNAQKYRAYLKEIKSIIEPQGFFDQSLGKIKDQSAQLNTEIERLKEPIEKLIGKKEVKKADSQKPDSQKPDSQKPDSQKPDSQKPDSQKPDSQKLDTTVNQSNPNKKGEIEIHRQKRFRANIKYLLKALLIFCFIPFIGYFASKLLNSIGKKLLNIIKTNSGTTPLTALEIKEKEERASTLFHVSKTLLNILIMIICLIYMLKSINVDVTPIIASAGVLGLALAFGSQALIKDFFAGFFILLENQYNIGDIVKINSIQGKIEQITLRLTILRDIEGTMHFIPNGEIKMVSNSNKGWAQARIEIGAAYQSEPETVLSALNEVVDAMKSDESIKDKIINMEVLGIERFDESAVIYRVHIQVIPGEQWTLARACRINIYHKFKEKGIEIPFPHMVIHQSKQLDAKIVDLKKQTTENT